MVDILIENCILVTMDPEKRVYTDGSLIIDEGKIIDIGKTSQIKKNYNADLVVEGKDKVALPGLMDGHGHAGHSLLKSLGMHNETWYNACEVIYSRASTPEFWKADAILTSLERLRFGTTTGVTFFGGGDSVMRVDDPLYAKLHCDAVGEIGVRTFLAMGPRRPPFPRTYTDWDGDSHKDKQVNFEEMVKNCEKVITENHLTKDGKINIALMFPTPHPESNQIIGEDLKELKHQVGEILELQKTHSLILTMDGHTRGTVKFSHRELALTGAKSLFSHSTELSDEEVEICSLTDTKIVHNPSAVASMLGRCPVPELLDAGVTVMLGSDGAAPDRSYDMFRHMFQAMRYQRRHYRDPRVLPPGKCLEMCTIDAARALGLEAELGSLEVGKKADITLIDLHKPHLYPVNMPVDRVVYYANGNDVDMVIVDGKILLENGVFLDIDLNKYLDMAQRELDRAVEKSGLDTLYEVSDGYWNASRY
jgi:cytosine/adenosine deaminase-related metal-dependent hydrolase